MTPNLVLDRVPEQSQKHQRASTGLLMHLHLPSLLLIAIVVLLYLDLVIFSLLFDLEICLLRLGSIAQPLQLLSELFNSSRICSHLMLKVENHDSNIKLSISQDQLQCPLVLAHHAVTWIVWVEFAAHEVVELDLMSLFSLGEISKVSAVIIQGRCQLMVCQMRLGRAVGREPYESDLCRDGCFLNGGADQIVHGPLRSNVGLLHSVLWSEDCMITEPQY